MIVDHEQARQLAEAHGLPEIEIDAALYGEPITRAEHVLRWIDAEEWRLRERHGVLEGRRRYRPTKMLRDYARKNRTGRWRPRSQR